MTEKERNYYQANKEANREKAKAYYQANKEAIRQKRMNSVKLSQKKK